MNAAEAVAEASEHCKRLAVGLKESGDAAQRARGAFIETVQPAFYAWLYSMEEHGVTPGEAARAFGQEVGAMLANMAHNCAHADPNEWVYVMGRLLVTIAKQQLARGSTLRIERERS